MKLKFKIILCFLFLISSANAQIKQIEIGERIPELQSHRVINYTNETINLSDFRGKLLILDFWATWCSPCIAAFPKMDALQRQFVDDIVILPVTYESPEKIGKFYNDSGFSVQYNLPSIVGDTILQKLFRHRELPHLVWIDSEGKVQAITGSEELNEQNITSFLKEKQNKLKEKNDGQGWLNDKEPIFLLGNPIIQDSIQKLNLVNDTSIRYYSILTRGDTQGIGASMSSDSIRISYTNTTILNLYKLAFSGFNWNFLNSRVAVELRDSSFIRSYRKGDEVKQWLKRYGYTYELKVPPEMADKKLEIMQDDLNRYFKIMFGIEGRLEEREDMSLVLKSTGINKMLETTGSNPSSTADAYNFSLSNKSIAWMVHHFIFTLQHLKMPIIDESGIDFNIDIQLNGKLSDLESINNALQPFNLKFEKAVRRRKMLVLADLKK